jgi:hypothetical protein
VPIVLKYWSLNLLEPSGSVQAWNGIAKPLGIENNQQVVLFAIKVFLTLLEYCFLLLMRTQRGTEYRYSIPTGATARVCLSIRLYPHISVENI